MPVKIAKNKHDNPKYFFLYMHRTHFSHTPFNTPFFLQQNSPNIK